MIANPTVWLVVIIVGIACAVIFLPQMHRVLKGLLIAIAVILFVVWLLRFVTSLSDDGRTRVQVPARVSLQR